MNYQIVLILIVIIFAVAMYFLLRNIKLYFYENFKSIDEKNDSLRQQIQYDMSCELTKIKNYNSDLIKDIRKINHVSGEKIVNMSSNYFADSDDCEKDNNQLKYISDNNDNHHESNFFSDESKKKDLNNFKINYETQIKQSDNNVNHIDETENATTNMHNDNKSNDNKSNDSKSNDNKSNNKSNGNKYNDNNSNDNNSNDKSNGNKSNDKSNNKSNDKSNDKFNGKSNNDNANNNINNNEIVQQNDVNSNMNINVNQYVNENNDSKDDSSIKSSIEVSDNDFESKINEPLFNSKDDIYEKITLGSTKKGGKGAPVGQKMSIVKKDDDNESFDTINVHGLDLKELKDINSYSGNELKKIAKIYGVELRKKVNDKWKELRKDELYDKIKEIFDKK